MAFVDQPGMWNRTVAEFVNAKVVNEKKAK
jgi:hypothetical protein